MAELWPDEDADPRLLFGDADRSRKRISKLMQLCRQVERALTLALADVTGETSLLAAIVTSVEPAAVERPSLLPDARAALSRRGSRLRREVAQSIRRKRAPELFDVRPLEAADD